MRRASVALLLVLLTAPIAAQPRLALSFGSGGFFTVPLTGRTHVINVATGELEADEAVYHDYLAFTADGRYLVALDTVTTSPRRSRLVVRDQANGSTSVLPIDGYTPTGLIAHPRRSEVLASLWDGTSATLRAISPAGSRAVATCSGTESLDAQISTNGGRLFYQCPTAQVHVLDGETFEDLAQFAIPRAPFVVNGDGSRLFTSDGEMLREYETGGGIERRSVPVPVVEGDRAGRVIRMTPAGDKLLIDVPRFSFLDAERPFLDLSTYVVAILDAESLTVLRTTPRSSFSPSQTQISPDGAMAFMTWTAAYTPGGRHANAHDLNTGLPLAQPWPLPGSLNMPIAMSAAPLPPVRFDAAVNGSQVTLTWDLAVASPMATSYVIEAGSAAGLSNLLVQTVETAATRLTFNQVPSGRYHVRLRAVNFAGRSGASSEAVVSVP